jgi:hypothetical protein
MYFGFTVFDDNASGEEPNIWNPQSKRRINKEGLMLQRSVNIELITFETLGKPTG